MTIVLPPSNVGPSTPPGSPSVTPQATSSKGPVTVKGPNATTIEILCDVIGKRGTLVNVRSSFAINADAVISASSPTSGYTIGDQTTIKFQIVPPRKLSVGGVPARPYQIRCLVEAVNAADANDKVLVRFLVDVPASVDNISGIKPIVAIDEVRTTFPVAAGYPTSTLDGPRTVVTTRYVGSAVVQDPQTFQVLGLILGPENSLGIARLQIPAALFSPPDPNYPTLPAYGGPYQGQLNVGDEAGLTIANRMFSFRGNNATRKIFVRVRAEDADDANKIYVSELEFEMQSRKTFTSLEILVRFNAQLIPLTSLPLNSGVRELVALDFDTVELLARVTGDAGTQAMFRIVRAPDPDVLPTFPAIGTIVSYNSQTGVQQYADTNYIAGVFGVDDKVAITDNLRGNAFRDLSPGAALQVRVDATSTVNVSNTLATDFKFRAVAPLIVSQLQFFYRNSRNPTAFLPVQAGTDINGPIIGTGTLVDPFYIGVDEPEQIEFFAVPTVAANQLAFVQTGYAYEPSVLAELYPKTPELWSRGFDNGSRVQIHPHPVAPGEQLLRPLTGEQFIVASGSKMIADGGDSKSKVTKLRAIATGVGNAANVIDLSIFIRIHDPAVLVP